MRKLWGVLVFLLSVGSAQAMTLTADADDFTAGTDISNAFAGLTLSFEGSTFDGTNDGIIYSVTEQSGLFASTGTRVFGTSDASNPQVFDGISTAVFRVDFSDLATSISLDALGDNGSDFAQLNAYTAGDVLVGTYATGELMSGNHETMTINGADIAYVIASGVGGDAVGFDNLVAQVVPVPAAAWFFVSALGILAARRRRIRH
ncbi:MAG: hypothetical protein ACR2P6_11255 [Gammaproteobacteria bacterium]